MRLDLEETLPKLYSFIAKLILALEEELGLIESVKSKNQVGVKKELTETLNKLVELIIRLDKLEKDRNYGKNIVSSSEDIEIINYFLEKYKK